MTEFRKLGVRLSYQAVQLITGHGNFKSYLHRIGRRDSAECDCGEEDTASHVLVECPHTWEWRERTRTEALRAGLEWPTREDEIRNNETATWWEFFSRAAEKIERLKHDD